MPAKPHPDWYRKAAKKLLAKIRAADPQATLSRAQFELARARGYSSWRALIADIEAAMAARQPAPEASIRPPLHLAAQVNDVLTTRELIESGADLEGRYGQAEHTPLSWAVMFESFDAAAALIAGGARTDLFCAAAVGDFAAVRSFFDANGALRDGASHTCRQRLLSLTLRSLPPADDGATVSAGLYAATRYKHLPVARFLIDRGADVAKHRYFGASILHWAYYGGSRALVELLLDAGADARALDDTFQSTPRAFGICAPVRLGLSSLVVERLRDDPMLATLNEGRGTPLHEAVRSGHQEIVRLLLAHGADPTVRDTAGRVPRDLATGTAATWAEVLL